MTFELITKLVGSVINTISNSTVAGVRAIKKHTFAVKVVNPVKKITVDGTVVVGNQKNLEHEVSSLGKKLNTLISQLDKRTWMVREQSPVKSVKIDNLKEISFVELARSLRDIVKAVDALPRAYPTKIKVNNQPLDEFKSVVAKLEAVEAAIKKLKLDPQINLPETRVVVPKQPAPVVNVEKTVIDYTKFGQQILEALYQRKPKEFVNVRLTDGEKFYEAMKEMVAITSGGGGNYSFRSAEGDRGYGLVDQNNTLQTAKTPLSKRIVKSGSVTYIGQALPGAAYNQSKWQCYSIDESDSSDVKIKWAGQAKFNQRADNLPSLTYE